MKWKSFNIIVGFIIYSIFIFVEDKSKLIDIDNMIIMISAITGVIIGASLK